MIAIGCVAVEWGVGGRDEWSRCSDFQFFCGGGGHPFYRVVSYLMRFVFPFILDIFNKTLD